jgi:predicted phage terminase large subunit-like protein
LLISKLEAVARGEIDRLLICMPPGSAKSTYTSVFFPGWFLANYQSAAVIAASHTTELAEQFGRRVRNLVAEHTKELGIVLREDSKAAGRWELESGGGYLGVGVGQAVLGYRADLAIVDDPHRSRESAQSEVERRNVWEWFSTDLMTRLRPGGRVVMISTRAHEEDLPGRVLSEMDKGGEIYETLILPAIAEENDPLGRKPGEFLWDDDKYYYGDTLRRHLATQSPMNWAGLFQQRPAPADGDYFLREWLKPYEKFPEPETLRTYAASDYAVTSKGGDYTVHVVVGLDPRNRLYLLDLWRAQTTPDVWIDQMLDMARLWKPISWAEETGQIKSSVGPFIDRRMMERKIPLYRQQFPTKHDKSVRAQAIRGRMALGGLYVPTKARRYAEFQQELMSFPTGKHDDIVDALGLVGQLLAIMAPPSIPERPKAGYDPKKDPYRAFGSDGHFSMYARGRLDPDADPDGADYCNIKIM